MKTREINDRLAKIHFQDEHYEISYGLGDNEKNLIHYGFYTLGVGPHTKIDPNKKTYKARYKIRLYTESFDSILSLLSALELQERYPEHNEDLKEFVNKYQKGILISAEYAANQLLKILEKEPKRTLMEITKVVQIANQTIAKVHFKDMRYVLDSKQITFYIAEDDRRRTIPLYSESITSIEQAVIAMEQQPDYREAAEEIKTLLNQNKHSLTALTTGIATILDRYSEGIAQRYSNFEKGIVQNYDKYKPYTKDEIDGMSGTIRIGVDSGEGDGHSEVVMFCADNGKNYILSFEKFSQACSDNIRETGERL
jgi:hypothetical protein